MTTQKSQKTVNKCLIEVKRLPLERFRIPSPGRKWKHIARQIQSLLVYLATFANGDGTFRHGERDYSPSVKTQAEHFGFTRRWVYKLQDYLKTLGLLSWTRLNRQEGRKYTITIPEVNDSNGSEMNDSRSEVNDSIPEVNSASRSEVNSMSTTSVSSVLQTVLPTVEGLAGRMARIYGQQMGSPPRIGKTGREGIEKALALAGSSDEVERHWKHWVSTRDLDGLLYPIPKFLEELPGLIGADSSSEREYTKEELAALKATIDRQAEIDHNEIMNRMPEPERVLSVEDLFGTGS
jgi:hypothetical protein